MKIYSSGVGTVNKYDMYEIYYKDLYNTNLDCIEAVYPELLQDEVIADCIAEARLYMFLIDKRMKEITDLNSGEITSVRLPGKIHDVEIKGVLE